MGGRYGPQYQVKAMQNSIRIGEAAGKDKTFARELLKSWNEYPGYENKPLPLSPDAPDKSPDKRRVVSKPIDHGNGRANRGDSGSYETLKSRGGRPRKTGEVSRTTAWRRAKEQQGALL